MSSTWSPAAVPALLPAPARRGSGLTSTAAGRLRHVELVWGTAVSFDVRTSPDATAVVAPALERAVAWLHEVDRVFSTYRADSVVTALREGRLAETDAPRQVRQVLAACRVARELTDGCFDPWAVVGGFDPSGYVKGWATGIAADLLVDAGATRVCVNGGGDVVVRGAGEAWRVGVRHPDDAGAVLRVVPLVDGAVATSGLYERGLHVVDPRTGAAVTSTRSATVVGPDPGLADALATGVLVAGREAIPWFDDLPGWSAYAVDDLGAWSLGPDLA
jgi:thiamine biosynthesis lipoprotein